MTWPEAFVVVGSLAVLFGFVAFIAYIIFRWL